MFDVLGEYLFADTFGEFQRKFTGCIEKQYYKLFAAVTAGKILWPLQALFQNAGHFTDCMVAGLVTVQVCGGIT